MHRVLAFTCLCLAAGCLPAQQVDLKLTLPPAIDTVVGVPYSIYYDNVILTQTPEAYTYQVTCDLGAQQERCWTVTPTAEQVGSHPLTCIVRDAAGTELARGETVVEVAPADAGAGRAIKVLIIGDSLTAGSAWPNELARLLSEPGNPTWRMLGTNEPKSAAEGVRHEGYGGWTWARFASHYEPNPDGSYNRITSPFVFLDENDKPYLDVPRYFAEKTGGEKPDVVLILLGINDTFGAPPDDPVGMDARIDAMFGYADTFLAGLREAAPEATIAIGLTTAPNSRQEAFEANYQDKYTRWGWKRIQHRLVQREIEKFAGREADGIRYVATELNIDPVDGYPANNGVHPNKSGYEQIGQSFYGWLKSWLSEPQ